MTAKDFELIAASIRKHGNNKEVLILDLSARLAAAYPRFKPELFQKACGM